MKVLGVNLSHHASVCVVDNGKITFALENDRLSKIKAEEKNVLHCLNYLKNNYFDYISYTAFNINHSSKQEFYKKIIQEALSINNIKYKELIEFPYHHLTHSFSAYYNSGFKKAICLVIDNGGLSPTYKNKELGQEVISIYKMEEDNYKDILKIYSNNKNYYFEENNVASYPAVSTAGLFQLAQNIFNYKEPGAVMGRASYGKENLKIPKIFNFEDNKIFLNLKFLNDLIYADSNDEEDFCYAIQKQSTEVVIKYLKFIKKRFPDYSICLSGGFFQNCMTNYEIIKEGFDVFVDPVSHDGGTCIGLAQHIYKIKSKKKVFKYDNMYLGAVPNKITKLQIQNTVSSGKKFQEKQVEVSEVASLINDNKTIAFFQGRSEFGPRALGNRSLLYNPSDIFAKEKINLIKNREWFRPYAGTVLYENKDEWFNFFGKDETKYMSYAVKIKDDKKNIIPGVRHIDDTCRVQTLKKTDNENFHALIKEFQKISGIPIVLNTSLNIAGQPLVESLEDALNFIIYTDTDYLYLPEASLLVNKILL